MKRTIVYLLTGFFAQGAMASDIVWFDGSNPVSYTIQKGVDPVVEVAAQMFTDDMQAVTGKKANAFSKNAMITVVQLDRAKASEVKKLKAEGVPVDKVNTLTDGFHISIVDGKIIVIGRNGRGTAYGLLELSRMAGVSPWKWWGDVVPEHKKKLTIDSEYTTTQGASVEYRGIFINDEDWTLRPWSYGNYDKAEFGCIGAKTYKRVFQLMMRLRSNAIWPAMHTGTKAFFYTKGAKAMADSCGISVGSSHCEPLLRNNLEEWNVAERGNYNYITNKENVINYWSERLKEVKGSKGGNMLTIGMRGIHDGSMEGVKTMDEKFTGLQNVINDQQDLIKKYLGDPSKQMQVFVPYKEVLQIYEKGLKVPDYVTQMWCDDNYGYMTRLSNVEEQKRVGGGGVYYHLSYWGRPHDYLWLCTTQPGLIYNEMRTAYDHNVRKLWIVNVHDPKIAGYDLELFLDLAWNIDCVNGQTIDNHYKSWLCREFGEEVGNKIFPAMYEFYKLCGERRPEFMGWSQVELDKKYYNRGLSPVANTEFSQTEFGGEMDRYLDQYKAISQAILDAEKSLRPELCDAYFAAIKYPVLCADANARKHLEAQRARSYAAGSTLGDMVNNNDAIYNACAKSQSAYQEIRSLTEYYNNTMANGKWQRSMNMRPRDLPVHAVPALPTLLTDKEVEERMANINSKEPSNSKELNDSSFIARNACDFDHSSLLAPRSPLIKMLGHSMNAVSLPKGETVSYKFDIAKDGEYLLTTALIPTQPNDKGDIRYSVSIDGGEPTEFSLKEPFRSERWKVNVLRGQARRDQKVNLSEGSHTLTIKALDDHIILDQWMIDSNVNRKYYLIPAK